MRKILIKWCDKLWLMVVYGIGLLLAVMAFLQWNKWNIPKQFLCLLAILLPLHVFEENTFPGGFHYMMNLVQKSPRPDVGPMNRLSDMISNFGGEMLFLILFLWGGNVGSNIFVAFFGIGESIIHSIFGVIIYKKLRDRGLKSIYGPGLATAYLTLLPLSVFSICWLKTQSITFTDVVIALLLVVCVVVLLIRIPIMVLGKYQPEYAFSSRGFYQKYSEYRKLS